MSFGPHDPHKNRFLMNIEAFREILNGFFILKGFVILIDQRLGYSLLKWIFGRF
jgi:hypothetical protein